MRKATNNTSFVTATTQQDLKPLKTNVTTTQIMFVLSSQCSYFLIWLPKQKYLLHLSQRNVLPCSLPPFFHITRITSLTKTHTQTKTIKHTVVLSSTLTAIVTKIKLVTVKSNNNNYEQRNISCIQFPSIKLPNKTLVKPNRRDDISPGRIKEK